MALKERVEKTEAIKVWFGELPVESLYTTGIAGERFFRKLKDDGQFIGTRCEHCGKVYVPGRIFCEQCLNRLDDWVKVGSNGVLESWTILYQGLDGKSLEKPIPIGMVRLDGASTVIIHRLNTTSSSALKIGMRVSAVLKPKNKREGSIMDILYFRPE